MKLKMYEIDAIVSEIVNKLIKHNNSLNIPTEKEVEKEMEQNHPVIIELNNLIKQEEEIKKQIKKIWKSNNVLGSFYETNSNIFPIIRHFRDEEMNLIKEKVGFKVIDQQRIRNLVILNSNKDLEEIINIVSSELGIKI